MAKLYPYKHNNSWIFLATGNVDKLLECKVPLKLKNYIWKHIYVNKTHQFFIIFYPIQIPEINVW